MRSAERTLEDLSNAYKFGDSLISKYARFASELNDRLICRRSQFTVRT